MNVTARMRFLRRGLKWIFLMWVISFVVIEATIYIEGRDDEPHDPEYIIVLGAGLRGSTPSLTLSDRLRRCIEYANENERAMIIVTGGRGRGENITEASAMEQYLVKRGIEKSRIIKEDKSTSTIENIKFAKQIMEKRKAKKVQSAVIVSNRFHLFRAKIIAKKYGILPYAMACETRFYMIPKYYIREYFAVIKLGLEIGRL